MKTKKTTWYNKLGNPVELDDTDKNATEMKKAGFLQTKPKEKAETKSAEPVSSEPVSSDDK